VAKALSIHILSTRREEFFAIDVPNSAGFFAVASFLLVPSPFPQYAVSTLGCGQRFLGSHSKAKSAIFRDIIEFKGVLEG